MADRKRNRANKRAQQIKKYRSGRVDAPTTPRRERQLLNSRPDPLLPAGITFEELAHHVRDVQAQAELNESVMLERAKAWCSGNGVAPHAKLPAAAKYLSTATAIGLRSRAEGETEIDAIRKAFAILLEMAEETDISGIHDALAQIKMSLTVEAHNGGAATE